MALLPKRSFDSKTLLASTTTVAGAVSTQGDEVRLPGMVNSLMLTLDVTAAATDVGDTLDVTVQTKIDGTNWLDVAHFAQVLGNGGAVRHIEKVSAGVAFAGFEVGSALGAGAVRDLLGDVWRVSYVQVDGDSNGTFTFSVAACPM